MADYFEGIYENFDKERFFKFCDGFGLEKGRRINTFSKGMKKQVSILLGLCAGTKYILCDETFDGLDPVVRQGVKSLFAADMADRGLTPVIASHNLRELEDICDHVGLLHHGGVILSQDIADMKLQMQKVQCVFGSEEDEKKALEGLKVLIHEKRGRLHTITIRGDREEIETAFKRGNPVFFEVLALSLEEIFISETEVVGYDIKKFILD
jgi:ABC-2 type transport system ATP-binding protein